MSLTARLGALPPRLGSPAANPRFDQAHASVYQAFPGFAALEVAELSELIDQLAASITNKNWTKLSEGDVAIIVRAYAADAIAMPSEVQAFLVQELSASSRRNLLGSVCDGFLESWRPRRDHTRELAQLIQKRSGWLPNRWRRIFHEIPELLDVENGAVAFGRWMAEQHDPYSAVLKRGILDPHSTGFMAHAHAAWLDSLPPLTNNNAVERALGWIIPSAKNILAGDRGAVTVSRLLQPWEGATPADTVRRMLLEKLLTAYGDPRKESEHFWSLVAQSGKRAILRWLAGRQMEAFLDVVTRAEGKGDTTAQAQWQVRRHFWMGMFKRGRIDEAWAAFTSEARSIAKLRYQQTRDRAYRNYGLQEGGRKDTCLLIMRLGNKIVVEGSHNFRVHVFSNDDPRAPSLYGDRYDVDTFLLPFPHENARIHVGQWREWVLEKIR